MQFRKGRYTAEKQTTNIHKKQRIFTFLWRHVKSVFFTSVAQCGPSGGHCIDQSTLSWDHVSSPTLCIKGDALLNYVSLFMSSLLVTAFCHWFHLLPTHSSSLRRCCEDTVTVTSANCMGNWLLSVTGYEREILKKLTHFLYFSVVVCVNTDNYKFCYLVIYFRA